MTRTLGLISTMALALSACTPVAGTTPGATTGGAAGGDLSDRCGGDFGVSVAATKLETFLSATADFTAAAAELEGSLIEACEDMGQELQVSEEAMAGKPGEPRVRAACEPVRAALEAELQDLRADAKLKVAVHAEPPRCEAKLEAYADCMAECDASIDPGKLELRCEGGELRGECEAECRGRCAVEVDGQCGGRCEGTCSGGCAGTCDGICEGTCSATAADGSCKGSCDGTCKGSCSAGCSGSCEGSCVLEASGSCEGECRGSCSVEFEEPYCTGDVRAPSASVDSQASCDARLDAKLTCEPGRVDVAVEGRAESNIGERAARVRAAIEGGMGRILAARAHLKKMGASGRAIVKTAGSIPNAVGELGLGAAACATQAAAILPRVTASVSASVEVSASLSATASAG